MDSNLRDRMLGLQIQDTGQNWWREKVSLLTLGAFWLCKLDPFLSRCWMASINWKAISLKNKLFKVIWCFIKHHLTPTSRPGSPTGCEGHRTRKEVSSITVGSFAHSDLWVSALSLWTFDVHLWFSNLHPGHPKNPRCVFHAPTPWPWDSTVVLACHLWVPKLLQLAVDTLFHIICSEL